MIQVWYPIQTKIGMIVFALQLRKYSINERNRERERLNDNFKKAILISP